VAKIIEAKDVEEADKLLEIRVDIGSEERTIFAGIKGYYDPSELVGKMIVVVANLKPIKMRFGVTECMLLASGDDDSRVISDFTR
jgi:EMAP domain